MKHALLFALALIHGNTQGQPTFEKLYTGDGSLKFIPSQGDSILVCMGWGPALTSLDSDGNVIRTYHVYEPELYAPLSVAKSPGDQYYFIGGQHIGMCGSSWRLDPVIGRMDTSGNVSLLRHYELNGACPGFLADLDVTQDGGVITWGREQSFFALKADPNLDLVWSKRIDRQGGSSS